MRFPNAKKGVSKIYISTLLLLIFDVLATASTIVGIVFLGLKNDNALAVTSIFTIVFGLGDAIVMLIGFILTQVGLFQSRKDEKSFLIALIAAAVGVVASVLSLAFSQNKLAEQLIDCAAEIAWTTVTLFVILGIMQLARALDREDMVKKGVIAFKVYLTVQLLYILGIFVGAVFADNFLLQITSFLLRLGSLLASVAACIVYLVFLSQSKKMLAEG